MPIKIESLDGTARNTRIIDTESGQPIGLVRRVEIVIDDGEPMVKARLEIDLPRVNVVVEDGNAVANYTPGSEPATPPGLDGLNLGPVV